MIEKEEDSLETGSRGWDNFLQADGTLLKKEQYVLNLRKFVSTPMLQDAKGIQVSTSVYGKGAERIVFHCREVCMHICIYIYIYVVHTYMHMHIYLFIHTHKS